jgi:hypothetical protein
VVTVQINGRLFEQFFGIAIVSSTKEKRIGKKEERGEKTTMRIEAFFRGNLPVDKTEKLSDIIGRR